jgi:alpha-tubulin suppressor-like RCC1 family protein
MTTISRTALPVLALSVLASAAVVAGPVTVAAAATPPPVPTTIGAGTFDSLVLGADGAVYGAGANIDGDLTGTAAFVPSLTRLSGLPAVVRATQVAAGPDDSVVLGSNGAVYGAGSNDYGDLTGAADVGSARTTLTPFTGLPSAVRATAISAGSETTLVLGSNGIAYGAGLDASGQLTGPGGERTTLTPLAGLPAGVHVSAITAGNQYSLVLGSDGIAYGTGDNTYGQLSGSAPGVSALTPLAGLPSGVHATAVSANSVDSLVLGSDGQVYGTGDNTGEELTTNVGTATDTLTVLGGLPLGVRAESIASGYQCTAVVGSDGRVYGAGSQSSGILTGSARPTLTPLADNIAADVTSIAVGNHMLLVRDAQGIVYGTGNNQYDQLTTGAGSPSTDSFEVLSGQRVVNTVLPGLSGAARYGTTISAGVGAWSLPPTGFSYQWRAGGAVIPGATGRSYAPSLGVIGLRLSVTVTAHRGRFVNGTATSAQSAAVGLGPALRYTGLPRPAVSGTAAAGHVLHVVHLALNGFSPAATSVHYQWLRSGRLIPGATNSSYGIRGTDRGSRLAVRISGQRAGYVAGTYTTVAVAIK